MQAAPHRASHRVPGAGAAACHGDGAIAHTNRHGYRQGERFDRRGVARLHFDLAAAAQVEFIQVHQGQGVAGDAAGGGSHPDRYRHRRLLTALVGGDGEGVAGGQGLHQAVVGGRHLERQRRDGRRITAIGIQAGLNATHLGHCDVVDAVIGHRQPQPHGVSSAVGAERSGDRKTTGKGIDVAVAGQVTTTAGHQGRHVELTARTEAGEVVDGSDHPTTEAVDADATGNARRHGGTTISGETGRNGGTGGITDDAGLGCAFGLHGGEARHDHPTGAGGTLREALLQLIEAVVGHPPQLPHKGTHRPYDRVGYCGAYHRSAEGRALVGNGCTQGP